MKINPAGNLSVTLTFLASDGPLLVTVTVHVIVSPNLGFLLDTILTISKSASSFTLVVLFPMLLSVLLSGVDELPTAIFSIVPFEISTIVLINNFTESSFAISPIIQIPLDES